MNTFLWHDYETTGLNTHRDRPAQFAAIRTDMDLNIIGDPVMIYCKPSKDVLPEPIAAMVTGITPQLCEENGLAEHEFAKAVEALLAQPGTIGVGYNTISYDDEITRFLFWRNLFDPYAREWQNNCGRWDIIDMVRAAYSLRSDGINWPTNSDGKPSFKLEDLSKANGLSHEAAHDALSDVRATISLAKLIKTTNPKLFHYAFSMHKKDKAAEIINTTTKSPFLHISRIYGVERGFISPVMPIQVHPTNKNEYICWDLTQDPTDLLSIDANTISTRLFTKREDRGDDFKKLGFSQIAINKSPMIVKLNEVFIDEIAKKWNLDVTQMEDNFHKLQQILSSRDLTSVLNEVYQKKYSSEIIPDEDLYGGFIDRNDRRILDQFNRGTANTISSAAPQFNDDRLSEVFFNFKARNYPNALTPVENKQWMELLKSRLIDGQHGFKTFEKFNEEIQSLMIENADDSKRMAVLNLLQDYSTKLLDEIQFSLGQKIKQTHTFK